MAAITIPKLNYFKQVDLTKNVYSGSVGTSPDKGCINSVIFEYKIYEEDGNHLVAKCKLTPPWYEPDNGETVSESFELSEDGIIKAEKWLSDLCDKLLDQSSDSN